MRRYPNNCGPFDICAWLFYGRRPAARSAPAPVRTDLRFIAVTLSFKGRKTVHNSSRPSVWMIVRSQENSSFMLPVSFAAIRFMGYGTSVTNGVFVRTSAVSAWQWQCLLPQLVVANKTTPKWIYNASTKGPWSKTRGPTIGALGPWA